MSENRDQFKAVRNRIRKYDVLSLVDLAVGNLREVEELEAYNYKGRNPWYLALIIKWALVYGGDKYPSIQATQNDLIKLVNMLHDFEGKSQDPFLERQTTEDMSKFFRTIAFQQFWWQHRLSTTEVARTYILFCKLSEEHPIQENFKRKYSISMKDFLKIAMIYWAWIVAKPENRFIKPEKVFVNVNIPAELMDRYLDAVSLNLDEMKEYLLSRKQSIRNPFLQLKEQAPLTRYPFLRVNQGYLVYSRRIFERNVNHMFYDVMKDLGGSELSELFGGILENYVDLGLRNVYTDYYVEADLQKKFPDRKVTDFVLPLKDCTVLLEVKAVEMRASVKVFPEDQILVREFRDSVLKAIIQGYELADSLSKDQDDFTISNRKEFFLLIVTYRQLYMGGGSSAWKEFISDAVKPELERLDLDIDLISPDRIVVLSIDEFDQMIAVLMNKSVNLSTILWQMLKDNADHQTSKFVFSMHFTPYQTGDFKVPYLDDEFNQVFDEAESYLRK